MRSSDTATLPASEASIGPVGRLPSSVNMALRRSTSWGRLTADNGRRRRAAASTWNTTASVITRTRNPAACTRQQKSTSSRNSIMLGSKPPTWSQTSLRTSMPALPTASASRSPSCWP